MDKATLAADLPQSAEIRDGYVGFFDAMMEIVRNTPCGTFPGEALRQYAMEFFPTVDIENFADDFSSDAYSRIYLGRDEATGWEAIMMCWTKGNTTPVHGHPQFAAYNFASGHFLVEVFENRQDIAVRTGTFEAGSGQGFFAAADQPGFENHIHRITCLSDRGMSLHIYSGDARQGIKYTDFIL